jgi:hypothetical protein
LRPHPALRFKKFSANPNRCARARSSPSEKKNHINNSRLSEKQTTNMVGIPHAFSPFSMRSLSLGQRLVIVAVNSCVRQPHEGERGENFSGNFFQVARESTKHSF